jgi:BirA family biotin operon repressor/biotin-[acetyl-CoA-carboxylase] ligase
MTTSPFHTHHFDTVSSTQDECWARVQSGAPSGTVISADVQTKGRGRQGRVWDNPPGNLAATLAWALAPGDTPGHYSFIVAVALARAVRTVIADPSALSIKWPNDLLLNGVKCAGILIESPDPKWILIGTGVNIAYAPDGRARILDFVDAVIPAQAGIQDHKTGPQRSLGLQITSDHILDSYLGHFYDLVSHYRTHGLADILAEWRGQAFGIDREMNVRLPNEEFTAIFRGLDENGAACAELPDGRIRKVHAGDVFFGV